MITGCNINAEVMLMFLVNSVIFVCCTYSNFQLVGRISEDTLEVAYNILNSSYDGAAVLLGLGVLLICLVAAGKVIHLRSLNLQPCVALFIVNLKLEVTFTGDQYVLVC